MIRLCSLFALSVALLVPDAVRAQSDGHVRFKFGWTPGMSAEVVTTTRTNMSAARTTPDMHFRLRLSTAPVADGILVQMSPMAGAPTSAAMVAGVDWAAASSVADYVITRQGDYVRLADTLKTRNGMDSIARTVMSNIGGMPPAAQEKMKEMLSTSYVEQASPQMCNQQTRFFLGREWKKGQEILDTTRAPSPMAMGATTVQRQRTALIAVVPCDSAAPAGPRCAHMRRVSTLDPASLRTTMTSMMREMAPGMDAAQLEAALPSIDAVTTSDMLLEIETLLTRRITTTMVQNMSMMGTTQRVETSSNAVYTYSAR